MIERRLVFLQLWNKFDCCGIHLGTDFMIRKKNVGLETPTDENHCCVVYCSVYMLYCFCCMSVILIIVNISRLFSDIVLVLLCTALNNC